MTITQIIFYIAAAIHLAMALYAFRLARRFRQRERELLADKEAWEGQKEAELIAMLCEPADAEVWISGEGDLIPCRIVRIGRN